jgi:putative PIG3 family NAD(P)H quinone oxidoreductase
MRAVVIQEHGAPEVLAIEEVEEPRPAPGEVVIDIQTTALNRADLLQRQGNYPPPPGAPPYPGLECAGPISALGEGVTRWQVGQRVMALLSGGGYAEKVAVPQETLLPVPDRLTWAEAAAIPEAWLTAYSNLIQIGRLRPGERVLIHAGGSGVGTAAIQLAKVYDAQVFSTASAGKLDPIRALGVDIAIDYRQESFADRVEQETSGKGVDVIIDFIGATYWQDNLRSLALWGRLVLVGLMGGRQAEVDLGLIMSRKLSIHGSTLRDRTLAQKGSLIEAFSQEILPIFESGRLRPVVDPRRFTLDEIIDAHRYMEANSNVGKIIVQVAAE